MKYTFGSESFNINYAEIKSVSRGLLIALAGAVATEITRQLTGANFTVSWNTFNIGPFVLGAGTYNLMPLVWVAWSGALNFARKYIQDNSKKPV